MALSDIPFLRGLKGGNYKNTPDTIRSEDTVEVILGAGEGNNFGLAEGAKSMRVGGTTMVSASGEPNFTDFELREYTGVANPSPVTPVLGGFGSPTQANASSLAQNVPIIRTGQLTNIDYIDMRFLIQALLRTDKKGTYADTLQIRIETRPSLPADQTWSLAWTTVPPVPLNPDEDRGTGPNGDLNVTRGGGTADQNDLTMLASVVTFEGDKTLLRNEVSPGPPIGGGVTNIWVNPANQRPYTYVNGSWTLVPATDNGTFWSSGTTRYYKNSPSPPPNPNVGDVWSPVDQPPLRYNGSSWVQSLIQSVANRAYSQPFQAGAAGVLSVTQKISSLVVREVRVPVARIAVPYDIRVTKTSRESSNVEGDNTNTSEVGWESFEEILAEGRTFPNTHILQLIARASDQFTSLPELEGDIKGRIIAVPSNYDPITRTYAGVWDGLFKNEWTDNGAWCTRDFIKNERYGLSSLYPYDVNEANFYAWAQWCDEPVPNGSGGSRPRWTYNDVLDQPRPAREQVNYMAGSCGGRLIDDGDGVYDVLIDKPEPISMIFGPESVIDGDFVYSFTDIQTRANWIKFGFINPQMEWGTDFRVVKDDDHIAEFGRIPFEFVATGKTNLSEGLASARLRLITNLTEYTACTFKTNRVGRFLFPFQTIGLCDPDMGWGVSGRLVEVTGAKQIRLRDAVFLEAGVLYKMSLNRATSPISTVTMTLVPGQTGSRKVIDFVENLPADLPEFAQFSLESYNAATSEPIALPKAFKILTITPSDGDSEAVEITCLELNRFKQAFVEGSGELLPADEFSSFNGPVAEVANARMFPHVTLVGGITSRSLIIEWDRPTNPFARNTLIEYSRDGAEFVEVARSSTEFYELQDLASGVHAVRLAHIHNDGIRQSRKTLLVHEVTSDYRTVPPVANLRLVDEPAPPEFESISPMVRWEHGEPDPNFAAYKVKVSRLIGGQAFNPATATWSKQLEKTVPIPEFIFEFDENAEFVGIAGVPQRVVRISVSKLDDFGSESDPQHVIIENTAPAKPTLLVEPVVGGFNVTISVTTERDVVAALVDVDGELIDGNQTSFFIPAAGQTERTLKAAYYDRFSKVGLNWSDPILSTPAVVPVGELDTTPPVAPTNPAATTIVGIDAAGNPTARTVVSWTASVSTDVAGYQIEVTHGGQTFIRLSGNTFDEFPTIFGRVYTMRVRAYDRVSNFSTWVNVGSVTPALDTTPPGLPQNFTALAQLGGFKLSWTAPADADLRLIRIYENTVNNSGDAGPVTAINVVRGEAGQVFLPYAAQTTRFFWLKSEDTSGNLSAFTASQTGTVPDVGSAIDTTPPPVPAGLSLTPSVVTDATGAPISLIVATWTSVVAPDLAGYELEIIENGGNPIVRLCGTNRDQFEARAGLGYAARVRSYDGFGNRSAWTSTVSTTATGDTTAPTPPTAFTVAPGLTTFALRWAAPTSTNVAFIDIYSSPTNTTAGATLEARVPARAAFANSWTKAGVASNVTLWFFLKAVSYVNVESGFTAGVSGTTARVGVTDFASSIQPVELFASNAAAGTPTTGRVYLNTTDGLLYRAFGGQWVSATPAGQISGTLAAAQIASVNAAAVTGQLTAAQIAAVNATAISGQLTNAQIASIASTSITGQLTAAQIAAVNATAIAGQLTAAQIASVNAAAVAGQLTAAQIAAVNATAIAGQLTAAQIAAVNATAISGQLMNAQIAAIDATKLTGAITSTQITDGAISTPKIATGAITAGTIAAGAITAGKIAAGAVTATEIDAGAITAGKIAAGSIVAGDIATGAITAEKVSAGAITAGKIAAGSIVAGDIATGAITAEKVSAGAITAGKIAAGSIAAGDIAALTITAGKIATNAIESDKILAGAITVGKVAAGAIRAQEIAANAITASKLAITDTSNLVPNQRFEVGLDGTDGLDGVSRKLTPSGSTISAAGPETSSWPSQYGLRLVRGGTAGELSCVLAARSFDETNANGIPTVLGDEFHFSGWAFQTVAGSWSLDLVYFNPPRTFATSLPAFAGTNVTAVGNTLRLTPVAGIVEFSGYFRNTTGPGFIWPRLAHIGSANGSEAYLWTPLMRRKNNGQLIVDGSITADKIVAGSITTDRLSTTGALPSGLTVGPGGATLGTIQTWADNPLVRAAANTTLLGAGFIRLTGAGATLASWQSGPDATTIAGGAIAANTIDANRLTIGNRGVTFDRFFFTTNGNTLSWTNGRVAYVNDSGTAIAFDVAGGAHIFASTILGFTSDVNYLYWAKGATSLQVTSNVAVARNADNIIVCSYYGGNLFTPTFGRTVIDGDSIKTGSIVAGNIAAGAITAVKISANAIDATKIVAGSITGDRIQAGTITGDRIAVNSITTQQLKVGSFDNLIQNGDFSQGFTSWTRQITSGVGAISIVQSTGWPNRSAVVLNRFGGNGPELTISSGNNGSFDGPDGQTDGFPWSLNEEVYVEAVIFNQAAFAGQIQMLVADANGGVFGAALTLVSEGSNVSGNLCTSVANNFQQVRGTFKNTSGAGRGYMRLGGNAAGLSYFWNVKAIKKATGEMIVNGSIKAEQITVSSIAAINANLGDIVAGGIRNAANTFNINLDNGQEFLSVGGGGVAYRGLNIGGGTEALYLWIGPDSIPRGSATKANAWVYVSNNTTNGGRFGGSEVGTPGGFNVSQSNLSRVGFRTGAGSVTSNTVTLTATGNTGGMTYEWIRISGDEINPTASSSATTAFIGTVPNGEARYANFSWRALDNGSGKSSTGVVQVSLISNA
jgi:predicted phage tail protein